MVREEEERESMSGQPAGERREGFRVFPVKVDRRRRNTVKIAFDIFYVKTLVEENF